MLQKSIILGLTLTLAAWCGGCATAPQQNGNKTRDSGQGTDSGSTYQYSTYYVRKGDTLHSIARSNDVDVDTLVDLNDSDPADLEVGQLLLIPELDSSKREESDDEGDTGKTEKARPESGTSSGRKELDDQTLHRDQPGGRFWWPTDGRIIRRFGEEVDGFNEPGIGIETSPGTAVHSVADGKVLCAISRAQGGWGNVVAIQHSNNFVSWYGSLGRVDVDSGDQVSQGDRIGTVGETDKVNSAQLAFRLFRDERPVDPLKHLNE